jgi:predicted metal-dependent hydrolase
MKVEVTRSTRRKKTVQAKVRDGILQVFIPIHFTQRQEAEWVKKMQKKVQRETSPVDLVARSTALADRFGLPRPAEIVWSDRQNARWGSCTPATGRVRIARQVSIFPAWVVDYVLVHELAHLVVSNHSKAFWELVNQYPLSERARGFLIAKSSDR